MHFILHVWRLLKAVTVHRNLLPETDIADTDSLPLPVPEHERPTPIPLHVAIVPEEPDDHSVLVPHGTIPVHKPYDRGAVAALKIDADGWLVGEKVVHIPTTRGGYIWRMKDKRLGGILWHWTATAWGTALAMARRISTGTGSSVHCWIEHDGTIYQSAPFTKGTGHAGGATAMRCKDVDDRIVIVNQAASPYSINSFALGIEIVNVGEVRLVVKEDSLWVKATPGDPRAVYMGWPYGKIDAKTGKSKKGPIVDEKYVQKARDPNGVWRYYHDYTQAQVDAAERLCRACRAAYALTDEAMSFGHVDVDPTRKADPGPLWSEKYLPEMLKRIDEHN